MDLAQRSAYEARDEITTGALAKAFEDGVPLNKISNRMVITSLAFFDVRLFRTAALDCSRSPSSSA
jgi:hypothetical protein